MIDDAPPANTEAEIGEVAKGFVDNIRGQVVAASKAGADDDDLCIVVPAGYMALVFAMPILDVEFEKGKPRRNAVCSKKQANALIATLIRESGWRP